MAKFYTMIGFVDLVTDDIGVTREHVTEQRLCCEERRNIRRLENPGQINDDVNISNEFSIVANPYAYQNFHKIRYMVYMGTKWKVTSVEISYPRLILSLGGVYHGEDEE